MKRGYRVENDSKGVALAIVPLGPYGMRGNAIIEEIYFDALISMGVSSNWNTTNGNVIAKGINSRNVSIARIITGAIAGQRVKYLDGNPLNLRRENLSLIDGWSMQTDELVFNG